MRLSEGSFTSTMLGSALSGTLARIPTHPIDTIKARLQARTAEAKMGAVRLFRHVLATEGLAGLYRGVGVTMMIGPFASMLYFGGYQVSKDTLAGLSGTNTATTHLGAGMLAEAFSCVLFVPVDVIKERMQVQGAATASEGTQHNNKPAVRYRSTLHAARTILASEGLTGLYRGYWATLGSFGPFSAIYFMLYDGTKQRLLAEASDGSVLGFRLSLTISAMAGAAASVVTNPLDLVKLRLQVQRGGGVNWGYTGLVHGLGRLVREEGLSALLRGAGTRVAFHAPTTAISMALFESCRDAVARLETSKQRR